MYDMVVCKRRRRGVKYFVLRSKKIKQGGERKQVLYIDLFIAHFIVNMHFHLHWQSKLAPDLMIAQLLDLFF